MKVIGIEIDKKRAIFYILEKDGQDNITNLTGKTKYISINDDKNNLELQHFQKEMFELFDHHNPDKITILSRQTKGRFAASSVSFKLEALIQCYHKVEIKFLSKPALASYYKKNSFTLKCDNSYQINACQVANILVHT